MTYVIRPRVLPAHLHTPTLNTVYDVTEATTTKPVPYGVHTSPGRALAHRALLIGQAAAVQEVEGRQEREGREQARARVEERKRREAAQAAKEAKTQ